MENNRRETMIAYHDWIEAIEEYPDELKHKIYRAIFLYALEGIEPSEPEVRLSCFIIIKKRIDRDNERYEAICERNRANARKGGAPKGNKNASKKSDSPTQATSTPNNPPVEKTTDRHPEQPYYNHNDNDNDNDNDNSNQSSPKVDNCLGLAQTEPEPDSRLRIDYKRVVDLWNKTCTSYPRLIKLTGKRRTKIANRLREIATSSASDPYTVLEQLFKALETSHFLKGDNDRAWKASFDWVIANDSNWLKVLEGNYQSGTTANIGKQPTDTTITDIDDPSLDFNQRLDLMSRHIRQRALERQSSHTSQA